MADAPTAALLADSDRLAKAWLTALIDRSPLGAAPQLPIADLVADGPSLCEALARALSSDDALDRLGPGGDLRSLAARAARLAGADDAATALAAIEALRAVLWEAICEALPGAGGAQVADLSQRLAQVCFEVGQAVLGGAGDGGATDRAGDARRESPAPPAPLHARSDVEPEQPPAPFTEPRLVVGDLRPDPAEAGGAAHEHFQRPGSDTGAWREAIDRRLQRRRQDPGPFAVLLVEADGIERLLLAETGREVAAAIESVERAVCAALRPADALVREGLGRYWIVAPDTGAEAAQALALRVAGSVDGSAAHRGAPLTVSIGSAVCPDDAEQADALAERAEQRMFAARASGRSTPAPSRGER